MDLATKYIEISYYNKYFWHTRSYTYFLRSVSSSNRVKNMDPTVVLVYSHIAFSDSVFRFHNWYQSDLRTDLKASNMKKNENQIHSVFARHASWVISLTIFWLKGPFGQYSCLHYIFCTSRQLKCPKNGPFN